MTGGAIANSKTYLKQTCILNENTWCFDNLSDMHFERDAHGCAKWLNRYIIVVGSWHGTESTNTCESYDVIKNEWTMLPKLNDATCAPGLVVMQDRFMYKLGGTSDIGKVEMLDLVQPKDKMKWVSIITSNKFGRKHTINRCLLHPLPSDDKSFLVLGCHFGRSEKPFVYDI